MICHTSLFRGYGCSIVVQPNTNKDIISNSKGAENSIVYVPEWKYVFGGGPRCSPNLRLLRLPDLSVFQDKILVAPPADFPAREAPGPDTEAEDVLDRHEHKPFQPLP